MPDPGVQIEYNSELQPLVELLSKVNRPGDFFTTGSLTVPLPRLEIDGIGTVSFPVPDTQVRDIIRQAEQAPYGRGEETLVDTTVRKVWQIIPAKVRLSGATWEQTFETILSRAVQGLGCQRAAVSAQLYKVLLYDAGAFFISHRDTEKVQGMFGTLVLVLPSLHSGGELVARHAGREIVLDLRTQDVSQLNYAAFYADCEHEVRPIKEGNRLCLIFNLIQVPGGRGTAKPLLAPDYEAEITATTKILSEWANRTDVPPKLAYLLEHQYSPSGLSFSGLKNADAALGKVLSLAAQRAGFAVHAGIVHIEESGSAEVSYDPYGHSRRRRRSYEEEAEEDGSEDFEVIEVCDCSQSISDWIDLEDQPAAFGKLPLGACELLPEGALDKEAPDVQRVMEATGNEGASFERAYHRAAIILWPKEKYPEVLLQGGVGAAIPYLRERIEECSNRAGSPGGPQIKQKALAVARLVVEAWETPRPTYRALPSDSSLPDRAAMLELLLELGDGPLLHRFIQNVVVSRYDGSENGALLRYAAELKTEEAEETLRTLVERNMPVFHKACVDLLKRLVGQRGGQITPNVLSAHRAIAAAGVQALSKVGAQPSPYLSTDWQRVKLARPVDGGLIADLMEVLHELDAGHLAEEAARILSSRGEIFAPDAVIVPGLALLLDRHLKPTVAEPALVLLWKHAAEFLLGRSEVPPSEPTDWAQLVKIECNCPDCRELQAFAAHPQERVHRFRVRQDRRQHLHGTMDRYGLDMTHQTERIGSPQTLVCTKTRRIYERRCKQYIQDVESFRTLLRLVADAPPTALGDLIKRVSGAVARARSA